MISAQELGRFRGSTVLSLGSHGLHDGDYRIALSTGRQTLGSSSFRVRSPDHPRAIAAEGYSPLGHGLASTAWAALSAAPADPERPAVRGASVPSPDAAQSLAASVSSPPRELRLVGTVDDDHDVTEETPRARGGDAPICLMGGAHHWVLEDGGRFPWRQAGFEATCRRCGLERFFPRRPGRGRRSSRGRQRAVAPAA